MLRIFASMAMMFIAVAWSALGVIIVFLFVPWLWEALFGPALAPAGAVLALVVLVWLSARMMRLADRLINEQDHAPRRLAPAAAEATADVPAEWTDYTAQIVRNKRWAFYRRTHQFDRLAELEAERKRN